MNQDDSVTARIITLALTKRSFSVGEALAHVGWGPERRAQMLVVLEHLANANIDVLEALGGDRYAATDTMRAKSGPIGRASHG